MAKITKTLIDSQISTKEDIWLWCSELPGFGVRIREGGKKTFVARYRTASGTQRKLTLGRCVDMTPDKARELARKTFAKVAEGQDPMTERADSRTAPTMADLRERYMKEHAIPFKKKRSVETDANNWDRYISKSKFSNKKVREVTKGDIMSLYASMSHITATANQTKALLSKAFNLCEEWGWRDTHTNPCRLIKTFRIKHHELILTLDQIQKLSRSLVEMETAETVNPAMALLIRLLILTGCRVSEIMASKREWVDVERGLLLLPDSKVGQRKIALSPQALELIADFKTNSQWLIPGRGDQPWKVPYKAWGNVKTYAGLPKELRLHDLRHTFGSIGHMLGLSQKQIAELLGHSQLSTTERYLHGHVGDNAKSANLIGNMMTVGWHIATSSPAEPQRAEEQESRPFQ